jgi:CheY-like chemotaxis protein
MKILVIDDSEVNLKAAVAQLGSEHEVVTERSAKEARYLLGWEGFGGGETANKHEFEVVLCDLLMPSPGSACRQVVEMDTGIYLAITAARNGAKYVGLLTDKGHHDHPASDCLDTIARQITSPSVFRIDNAFVCMTHNPFLIKSFNSNDLSTPVKEDSDGSVRAKNWKGLLAWILQKAQT